MSVVALRKESVDRNLPGNSPVILDRMSLSVRRAWIEMETGDPVQYKAFGRSP